MHDADRRSDVRAGSEAKTLLADEKLGLAFENVERVDMIVMCVRVGPFEAGLELELDQRELLTPDLDRRDSVLAFETFAFSGREEDGLRTGEATARWSVDAVEAAGLAAIPSLQIRCETPVRRVEVQESRARRAPEAVDDLPGNRDAGARRQQLLLVVDKDSSPPSRT